MPSAFDLATLVQSLVQPDIPRAEAAFRQICVHMLWGLLLQLPPGAQESASTALAAGPGSTGRGLARPSQARCPRPTGWRWLSQRRAGPARLLCGMWLRGQTRTNAAEANSWSAGEPPGIPWLWALFGMALGWVLALDTFAALPFAESSLCVGFQPLGADLPGDGWRGRLGRPAGLGERTAPLAIALHVITACPAAISGTRSSIRCSGYTFHGAVALRVWQQLRGRVQTEQGPDSRARVRAYQRSAWSACASAW
jgi:hypothetical protein